MHNTSRLFVTLLACLTLWHGCSDTEEDSDSGGESNTTQSETTPDASNTTPNSSNTTVDDSNTTVDDSNTTVDDSNTTEPAEPWADCEYPSDYPMIANLNETMPPLNWLSAFSPDGTERSFSMREVYCSEEFAEIESLIFISSSGWCPNCPDYIKYIDSLSFAFEEANALIVWMEIQDRNYNPAYSDEASTHFNSLIGTGPGIRVGDADVEGGPAFTDSYLVQAFPSQFVVRKRDMKVIVASSSSEYITPVLQIARHPEEDWDNPSANALATTVGEPCISDADCDTGTLISYCIPSTDPDSGESTGWRGGYCLALGCSTDDSCGPGQGNICVPQENLDACYRSCDRDAEENSCRTGYDCRRVGGLFGPNACAP